MAAHHSLVPLHVDRPYQPLDHARIGRSRSVHGAHLHDELRRRRRLSGGPRRRFRRSSGPAVWWTGCGVRRWSRWRPQWRLISWNDGEVRLDVLYSGEQLRAFWCSIEGESGWGEAVLQGKEGRVTRGGRGDGNLLIWAQIRAPMAALQWEIGSPAAWFLEFREGATREGVMGYL
jgi:hypothetical protein